LNPKRFTIFSTDGDSGVQNFKYMCLGFLCHVCGLISLNSWLFLWFLICGLFQVLYLALVVNFYFFSSHFLVTTLRLDLFTGTCFKKLLVLSCPVFENSLIQGVCVVRCFFACKRKQPVSEMSSCMFKKLDEGSGQLASDRLCSLFWISWPLKLGLIHCPKILVGNYRCR